MSDGPHRCLSLRKAWKDAALAADRAVFSDDEVSERVRLAIGRDWASEVPQGLMVEITKCFDQGGQVLLFPPTVGDIAQLRDLAVGSVMGGLLVSHAEDAAGRGLSGLDAVESIVRGTLEERGERCLRHIQEIYQRESNDGRAHHVISRVSPAISKAVAALAPGIAEAARPPRSPSISRSTGLDDGVPLK